MKAKKVLNHKHYRFDFQKVLEHKQALKLFTQHCKKEFNNDNLEFLLAFNEFNKKFKFPILQSMETTTSVSSSSSSSSAEIPEAAMTEATEIMKTFIHEQANKEINVSSAVRSETIEKFNQIAKSKEYSGLSAVFQKAHSATLFLLGTDVFPRFVRSTAFIQWVEGSSTADAEAIGTHLSKASSAMMSMAQLKQKDTVVADYALVGEMQKDYYRWKLLKSNTKLGWNVFVGSKTYCSPEIVKKEGDLVMAKVDMYIRGVSAHEMANAHASEEYLPIIFPTLKVFDVIEYHVGGEKTATGPIIREELHAGGLVAPREFIFKVSGCYDPKSKKYEFILRSCDHEQYPPSKTSKAIRGLFYSSFTFQHIDSTTCKFIQVCNMNLKGWIHGISKALDGFWVQWAMDVIKGMTTTADLFAKNVKPKLAKMEQEGSYKEGPYERIPLVTDKYKYWDSLLDNKEKHHLFF